VIWGQFMDVKDRLFTMQILDTERDLVDIKTELKLSYPDPVIINCVPSSLVMDSRPCVISSVATIKFIVEKDFELSELLDFSSANPKRYRICIYRDEELKWFGTVDTETFEETLAQHAEEGVGIVVTISASDFNVLEKISLTKSSEKRKVGVVSFKQLLDNALLDVFIPNIPIVFEESIPLIYDIRNKDDWRPRESNSWQRFHLDFLASQYSNFYDEDGSSWSKREIVEELLSFVDCVMYQDAFSENGSSKVCVKHYAQIGEDWGDDTLISYGVASKSSTFNCSKKFSSVEITSSRNAKEIPEQPKLTRECFTEAPIYKAEKSYGTVEVYELNNSIYADYIYAIRKDRDIEATVNKNIPNFVYLRSGDGLTEGNYFLLGNCQIAETTLSTEEYYKQTFNAPFPSTRFNSYAGMQPHDSMHFSPTVPAALNLVFDFKDQINYLRSPGDRIKFTFKVKSLCANGYSSETVYFRKDKIDSPYYCFFSILIGGMIEAVDVETDQVLAYYSKGYTVSSDKGKEKRIAFYSQMNSEEGWKPGRWSAFYWPSRIATGRGSGRTALQNLGPMIYAVQSGKLFGDVSITAFGHGFDFEAAFAGSRAGAGGDSIPEYNLSDALVYYRMRVHWAVGFAPFEEDFTLNGNLSRVVDGTWANTHYLGNDAAEHAWECLNTENRRWNMINQGMGGLLMTQPELSFVHENPDMPLITDDIVTVAGVADSIANKKLTIDSKFCSINDRKQQWGAIKQTDPSEVLNTGAGIFLPGTGDVLPINSITGRAKPSTVIVLQFAKYFQPRFGRREFASFEELRAETVGDDTTAGGISEIELDVRIDFFALGKVFAYGNYSDTGQLIINSNFRVFEQELNVRSGVSKLKCISCQDYGKFFS
jgi:hypothetical protein